MLLYSQTHQQLSPEDIKSLAIELEHLADVAGPDQEELEADLETTI